MHASMADVLVIGYGSLMSGLGLQPLGQLRARGVMRVVLHNAARGFGKFSQHGDRFAMVLEPIDIAQPIVARPLSADSRAGDVPEGLAFRVQPNDLARLAEREGYSSGAVQRLREEASRRGEDIAAFLWHLLDDSGGDVSRFRERLFRLVSYTSPHYLPQPVALEGQRFALTFVAPGAEGSGSPRIVPVRVRTGHVALMSIVEAWQRKPNGTQLTYFMACLLGGVHGVYVGDLLRPLADDSTLRERLRGALPAEQRQELGRFLAVTGLDHATYWQAFGPPTHALRRSGLEQILRG
jgi:cation transport regulator ChaC